ncbi:hypothetical protein NMY22_g18829 [Coprinellus aureogranulatus]|nr:hypothetical protein NMY22_g18829 [Coprinellus aureogranulatus]
MCNLSSAEHLACSHHYFRVHDSVSRGHDDATLLDVANVVPPALGLYIDTDRAALDTHTETAKETNL